MNFVNVLCSRVRGEEQVERLSLVNPLLSLRSLSHERVLIDLPRRQINLADAFRKRGQVLNASFEFYDALPCFCGIESKFF